MYCAGSFMHYFFFLRAVGKQQRFLSSHPREQQHNTSSSSSSNFFVGGMLDSYLFAYVVGRRNQNQVRINLSNIQIPNLDKSVALIGLQLFFDGSFNFVTQAGFTGASWHAICWRALH
jgi:hypothetical protein